MSQPHAVAQPNMQPSNDPMGVHACLDALPARSSKVKKDFESIKAWVEDLNQAFPGHVTDTAPCVLFYIALEEYIGKVESRSGFWKRRGAVNLSKVKTEYLLLRPNSALSQPATTPRAITMVEHAAGTLAVIGEAVPGAAPLKGVGAALERIAELAKTAKGNRDEATRLSKHAAGIKQQLIDNLNGSAPTVDKEIERDLGVFEVALNAILCDLERFQKPKVQAFVFAKDRKDELRGLQQRLDDAFKGFLTANMMALRLGMARLEARSQESVVVGHVPDEKVSVDYSTEGQELLKRCMGALSDVTDVFLHQFRSTSAGRFFFLIPSNQRRNQVERSINQEPPRT